MLHRFRCTFFQENLVLIVLGLLRESELTEWELLNLLYSRYQAVPTSREFRRLAESLIKDGYIAFKPADGSRKMRITESGVTLLNSLDEEYRAIVSRIEGSRPAGETGP